MADFVVVTHLRTRERFLMKLFFPLRDIQDGMWMFNLKVDYLIRCRF